MKRCRRWVAWVGRVRGAALMLLVVGSLTLVVGCRTDEAGVRLGEEASLGEEVSLGIGDSAIIVGEGLEITFTGIAEDSRCPKDVVCVWEGRVRCGVEVAVNGATSYLELVQPGLTSEPASQEHLGYRFTFTVEPYPEEGTVIALEDYELRLTVTR